MQRKLGKHGNSCIISSILSRSWPQYIILVSEDYFTAAAHLRWAGCTALALRYKKLRSLFNRLRKQVQTNYLYNFILPTKYALSLPDGRERPIRPTQITSGYVSFVITSNYQYNSFYFNKIDNHT